MSKIKVLLVDDHQLIRIGIAALLNQESDIEVVGQAESGQNLVHVVQDLKPNVILMDISLEDGDGIELTEEITRLFRKVKVVMLSMHVREDYIQRSIQAGAFGYVLKDCPKEELVLSVKKANEGEKYFAKEVSALMVNSYVNQVGDVANQKNNEVGLTKREIEIIEWISEGLSNVKIAEKLNISNRTVDTHRTNILKKTGVKNVAELVKYSIVNNIIEI
jgi:DNA-binding NarL/FixJ family response regulator